MTKENKKTNKLDSKSLTLQDWVDKLTTTVISLEDILEYKLKHKSMTDGYYLILEAKRPRYSISDIKYYKNNIEIFSIVKDNCSEYKPSFMELSMNSWELVNEDFSNRY